MASLKDIRTRIGSVKNTQKITRAMKLVAAAKLRRAQEQIVAARPYAIRTKTVMSSLASRLGGDADKHPLLRRDPNPKHILLIVLTSDRGLAGGFNSSITKAAHAFWDKLEDEGKHVTFAVIGRKGAEYFRRRGATIDKEFRDVFKNISLEKAHEIADYVKHRYAPRLDGVGKAIASGQSVAVDETDLDACYIIYNEFKSAMSQEVVVEQLFPIEQTDLAHDQLGEMIFEPTEAQVLDRLLHMYVGVEIFRALLESVASEHGARMTAMESATNNAKDMIDSLTLQYNRARQAAITTELMEIISGAESLK